MFGASGQIGAACRDRLQEDGYEVLATSRKGDPERAIVSYDPAVEPGALPGSGRFEAIVWAQGANLNDSVVDFDADRHRALYEANALFVASSLHALLKADRIADGARLCVISSVWQRVGRTNKLSYMMTKAAVQGLVMSVALDLADRGIVINAVLPGALDTPMTRQNLTGEQIERLANMTPFARLPAMNDVASLVSFLCSSANTSITGQFVAVDLGFEHARLV
jgi:NAD(P)-dependent dehydrogenase (short-subunit alcohol dehydrogenase family)